MRISDWSSDVCSSDLRTGRVLPGRMVRKGIAGAVEADILGQGDGQLRHRHRLRAAGGAEDDGDRTAPIALTRDTPVEQAELDRSEEHTSEHQSLMRISYAVFCVTNTNKEDNIG